MSRDPFSERPFSEQAADEADGDEQEQPGHEPLHRLERHPGEEPLADDRPGHRRGMAVPRSGQSSCRHSVATWPA